MGGGGSVVSYPGNSWTGLRALPSRNIIASDQPGAKQGQRGLRPGRSPDRLVGNSLGDLSDRPVLDAAQWGEIPNSWRKTPKFKCQERLFESLGQVGGYLGTPNP